MLKAAQSFFIQEEPSRQRRSQEKYAKASSKSIATIKKEKLSFYIVFINTKKKTKKQKTKKQKKKQKKTRNVTVCNKCPQRPSNLSLTPKCDLKLGQGTPNFASESLFLSSFIFCLYLMTFALAISSQLEEIIWPLTADYDPSDRVHGNLNFACDNSSHYNLSS